MATRRRRRRTRLADDEEELGGEANTAGTSVPPSQAFTKPKRRRRGISATGIAIGGQDSEDDSEASPGLIKLKGSGLANADAVAQSAAAGGAAASLAALSTGRYSEADLASLRSSQQVSLAKQVASAAPEDAAEDASSGMVRIAAAARAQRSLARAATAASMDADDAGAVSSDHLRSQAARLMLQDPGPQAATVPAGTTPPAPLSSQAVHQALATRGADVQRRLDSARNTLKAYEAQVQEASQTLRRLQGDVAEVSATHDSLLQLRHSIAAVVSMARAAQAAEKELLSLTRAVRTTQRDVSAMRRACRAAAASRRLTAPGPPAPNTAHALGITHATWKALSPAAAGFPPEAFHGGAEGGWSSWSLAGVSGGEQSLPPPDLACQDVLQVDPAAPSDVRSAALAVIEVHTALLPAACGAVTAPLQVHELVQEVGQAEEAVASAAAHHFALDAGAGFALPPSKAVQLSTAAPYVEACLALRNAADASLGATASAPALSEPVTSLAGAAACGASVFAGLKAAAPQAYQDTYASMSLPLVLAPLLRLHVASLPLGDAPSALLVGALKPLTAPQAAHTSGASDPVNDDTTLHVRCALPMRLFHVQEHLRHSWQPGHRRDTAGTVDLLRSIKAEVEQLPPALASNKPFTSSREALLRAVSAAAVDGARAAAADVLLPRILPLHPPAKLPVASVPPVLTAPLQDAAVAPVSLASALFVVGMVADIADVWGVGLPGGDTLLPVAVEQLAGDTLLPLITALANQGGAPSAAVTLLLAYAVVAALPPAWLAPGEGQEAAGHAASTTAVVQELLAQVQLCAGALPSSHAPLLRDMLDRTSAVGGPAWQGLTQSLA